MCGVSVGQERLEDVRLDALHLLVIHGEHAQPAAVAAEVKRLGRDGLIRGGHNDFRQRVKSFGLLLGRTQGHEELAACGSLPTSRSARAVRPNRSWCKCHSEPAASRRSRDEDLQDLIPTRALARGEADVLTRATLDTPQGLW